jgi:hypothetical protein
LISFPGTAKKAVNSFIPPSSFDEFPFAAVPFEQPESVPKIMVPMTSRAVNCFRLKLVSSLFLFILIVYFNGVFSQLEKAYENTGEIIEAYYRISPVSFYFPPPFLNFDGVHPLRDIKRFTK